MGNKGSNTTTSTTQPNPQAMSAYNDILSRSMGVASLPYQAYGGELVPGMNAQQYAGIGSINQNAGYAQPFIGQAAQYAGKGATPLSASDIQQYMDPYTQQVVNATQAQFNNQNAQQQQQVIGNAAAQNALGGDRVGVAQANLAGQQQLAQNPVIAGLYKQGYTQALSTAEQQKQDQANAAYSFGNLGVAGQNAALTGASAQLGAGSLEWQNQMAQDAARYQQFQMQQAFPYQQAQWLAGIGTGVGSQMGGTSTTTGPPPNQAGQYAGLGLAGIGAIGQAGGWSALGSALPLMLSDRRAKEAVHKIGSTNDGQPIYRYRYKDSPEWHIGLIAQEVEKSHPDAVHAGLDGLRRVDLKSATDDSARRFGGGVNGYDAGGSIGGIGGMPYEGVGGYIPGMQITRGSGPPKPPGTPQDQGGQQIAGLGSMGSMFSGWPGSSTNNLNDPASQATIQSMLGDLGPGNQGTIGGIGGIYRHGGGIGYADGGAPDYRLPEGAGIAYGDVGGLTPEVLAAAGARRLPPENDFTRGDPIWQGRETTPQSQYNLPPLNIGDSGVPVAGLNPAEAADRGIGSQQPGLAYAPTVGDGGPPPPQRGGVGQWTPEQRQRMMDVITGQNQPPPVAGVGYQSPPPTSPWLGVMAAGLGMMASRSPFLGTAIGEGGLAGLSAYSQQRAAEVSEAEKKATIEQRAQQLAQHADEARKTLASHTLGLMQTQEHQQQELSKPRVLPIGSSLINPQTGQVLAKGTPAAMNEASKEIGARQLIQGDMSVLTNRGKGAQGAAEINELRNRASDILTAPKEDGGYGMTQEQAAAHMSNVFQQFKARGIGLGAGARTSATREANLDIILRATDAAIPAAIEASDKMFRTGFVPLNQIIQKGQVMTSNPELREFGMANLQLAEHWARAMNPTGVMRESDRDKALSFLSTADSPETYRRVVAQLRKQIERERAAVASGGIPLPKPVVPGGTAPSESGAATSAAPAVGERKQFKQGWGVWNGTAWVPERAP